MKKASLRRTLCLAMATITAVCFTACGAKGASTSTSAENAASGLVTQGIITVVDIEPDSSTSDQTTSEATSETTTGETNATTTTGATAQAVNRKFQGTIVDKYPEADYIESIADGKFVILFREYKKARTNGVVYDINSDKELNSFTVYNCDTYYLVPVIFYGQGFGFITPHGGAERGVYAYYYDTDGNLVNKFDRKNGKAANTISVLAPDGSALYVVADDRVQCACGYDLKPDYTTQIYKMNPDGSEEMLAEYDSHYIICPIGVTTEGRLVLVYNYNSMDKTGLSHMDYERLGMLASRSSAGDAYTYEIGYAFMNTDKKIWTGEEIEASEVVEEALKSGADQGLKAAAAGALKVGVEKGIIKVIPKGTPASVIANIAYVAVEDAKVLKEIADGNLTVREGLEKMEETTVSTAAGLIAMEKGAEIGAALGTVLGPAGIVVGGLVGGAVGYCAGSKVGQGIVKVKRTICEKAKETVSNIKDKVSDFALNIKAGLLSLFF